MTLNPLESLLLALACLLAGGVLNQRIGFLARYNIPAPVTGGLAFAALAAAAAAFAGYRLDINEVARPVLLLLFFGGVGLGADLSRLASGGRALLRFLMVLAPFIALQNMVGIGLAMALDLHPLFGLVAGSVTQVGGHGTGAAYAERFAEVHNLQSVMEMSMTAATIGLIMGGIVAGPVAQYLIKRHNLRGPASGTQTGDSPPAEPPLATNAVILALAGALLAVVVGQRVADAAADLPVTVPAFLWCMLVGVAVRNLVPFAGVRFDDRASELLAGISLALFLVMTMMTLDLVEVALSSGPLLVILAAQAVLVAAFAVYATFRVLGRDYEAAVSSAAFVGFMMGSTATAIANMQAVTGRYGPAPMAFLVVPLVGAFFVDLLNAALLTAFLSLRWLGG